jgi:hypothetical protein
MANVLMKSGEIREIADEEMLSFLEENRDLIQIRHYPGRRPIKWSTNQEETVDLKVTSTK